MIDVGYHSALAGELDECKNSIYSLKRKFNNNFAGNINSCWQGEELAYINKEIENIIQLLSNAGRALDGVGSDIVSAAEDIRERQEEEEREREREEEEERKRAKEEQRGR